MTANVVPSCEKRQNTSVPVGKWPVPSAPDNPHHTNRVGIFPRTPHSKGMKLQTPQSSSTVRTSIHLNQMMPVMFQRQVPIG